MKKFVSIIIVFVMLITMFTACTNPAKKADVVITVTEYDSGVLTLEYTLNTDVLDYTGPQIGYMVPEAFMVYADMASAIVYSHGYDNIDADFEQAIVDDYNEEHANLIASGVRTRIDKSDIAWLTIQIIVAPEVKYPAIQEYDNTTYTILPRDVEHVLFPAENSAITALAGGNAGYYGGHAMFERAWETTDIGTVAQVDGVTGEVYSF